jgi:RNA-directed DNA polymerase
MQAKLRMINEEMRRRMHQPIPLQGKWLRHVVRGYFNYHAVPTNCRALVAFRTEIAKRWHRVLTRRSERTKLNWERMKQLIDEWLPKPRILHPWPKQALRRLTPEVGAVCGKAARTDLCGGRPVTGVPTATGASLSRGSVARRRGRWWRGRSD